INMPLERSANPANPWFLQKRASADGDKDSLFVCSLPPGGESLTGVLRSKPFTIPARLLFWLAGHDVFPGKPPQRKNYSRLRLTPFWPLRSARDAAAQLESQPRWATPASWC